MRICVVYDTEKLVHREHKVGRYLLDEGDAVSLLSETEQQAYGVVDYPSVEVDYLGRGHLHAVVAVVVGDILDSDSLSFGLGSSSQQVIAGNIIIVCYLYEEIESAFTDALLIV